MQQYVFRIFTYMLWLFSVWEYVQKRLLSVKSYLLSGHTTHIAYIYQDGSGFGYDTVFDLEHKPLISVLYWYIAGVICTYLHTSHMKTHNVHRKKCSYMYKLVANRTLQGELRLDIYSTVEENLNEKDRAQVRTGKYNVDIKDVVYVNARLYNGKMVDVTQYVKDIKQGCNGDAPIPTDLVFIVLECFYRFISTYRSFCTELYIMDGYSFIEYIYKKYDLLDI